MPAERRSFGQRQDRDWLIRDQESGGAVNDIGHYVRFCKEDGSALNRLQPVKNFMPNGLLDQKRKA
ncbi:MAG TPA: hypothetical protein VF772_00915 [Terriglobales bacterium]